MSTVSEKLRKFSFMVMKEADEKKKEIISEAERENRELIDKEEIQSLKKAYERIQEAIRVIDKEMNEKVSKALLESKHALFKRREEMIELIFLNVKTKISQFKREEGYKSYIEDMVKNGLNTIGQGDVQIYADSDDLALLEEIKQKNNLSFDVLESDDKLLGGLVIVNRSKGILLDYSFKSKLDYERENFLENFGLSIE